jgi:phosphoglycerol transferase MdoB-like AlkP superfamily enzyme
MGLYPDSTRSKASNSFYASRNSYLPYTLGTVFQEQAGIQAYGYHNYVGSFYGRNETHPNIGYEMKFAGDGMTFTSNWPASDLEMMEQSADDYISADSQFHAYYITFSGHYMYDTDVNPMANKNWGYVADQPYSVTSRAYMSCNMELDKALEYLMKKLEDAGVADKTAIVLAADHFPYGLSDGQYQELVDYEVDSFSKYRSSLLFWVGGLKEPLVVKEYCSTADVLPTILNLWGFPYDSRMYPGTDVFSDGVHAAVLVDHSFLTDKVWFNSNTGEIRYQVPEEEVPENYIENMNQLIASRFDFSAEILRNNYYQYVFGQD